MSARELSAALGRIVEIELDGLSVRARILDARLRFGNVDYLLEPLAGSGSAWKDSYRARLIEEEPDES